MIFISVGTAIGIVFHDSKYHFHARDKFGLPSESGKVLYVFLKINLRFVFTYGSLHLL